MSKKSAHPRTQLAEFNALTPVGEAIGGNSKVSSAVRLAASSGKITLQALIDLLPDYFWIKDLSRRFVLVNKSLALNNGFARTDEMIGLSDYDIHQGDCAGQFHQEEQEILESGVPIIQREENVVEAGVQKWLSSTKFPLRDDSGQIIGLLGSARDISETIRARADLSKTKDFWYSVVENVPDAIIIKNAIDRRYTVMNSAAEKMLGISKASAIGKTADDVYPAFYADFIRQEDDNLLNAEELTIEDHDIYFKDGESRVVIVKRKLLRDEQGEPQFMLAVLHDITERKRAEQKAAYLAEHDTLTGLPNRAFFNKRLHKAWENAQSGGAKFAILAIDLDRLNEVNDMFGHAAGDHLLVEVSRRFTAAAPEAFVARLGGDEFAIIVEGEQEVSGLFAFSNRLAQRVGCEINIDGAKYCPTISVGVAVHPEDGGDATTLLANADSALYRAKAEGRCTTRFFERAMDMQLRTRRAIRHDLHFALERNEFSIHYQPKAKLNGEIIGFEALLRWSHPTRGWVSPAEFIPAAEETRLIVEIGEWVLREVCREACDWPAPLHVAVNLSPVQFQYGDLTKLVHSILLETGLPASRLALEITEGVLITDSVRALTVLRQLKAFGVRIVMDDFGKGYSSLSYLQLFPFDKIKIDREFVHNVSHNPQSAAIVRAVLGLAHALDLPVLAEGVETEEDLDFLRGVGCDEMQGYLIGRPAPIAQYDRYVGRCDASIPAEGDGYSVRARV